MKLIIERYRFKIKQGIEQISTRGKVSTREALTESCCWTWSWIWWIKQTMKQGQSRGAGDEAASQAEEQGRAKRNFSQKSIFGRCWTQGRSLTSACRQRAAPLGRLPDPWVWGGWAAHHPGGPELRAWETWWGAEKAELGRGHPTIRPTTQNTGSKLQLRTRWWRSRWTWSTSLSKDTSGIHLQTQKGMHDTSWGQTGVPNSN